MAYPEPVEALIEAFERFPGIGRRSAERLSLHVLRDPRAAELARSIERAVNSTLRCKTCRNVSESNPCRICSDVTRNVALVCVVEEPRHVEALERAGVYRGLYHVLMGSFNPADGTEREQLGLDSLCARVLEGGVKEVVLALDPDAEGEATSALVLTSLFELEGSVPRVTRLARGLPAGSAIEYLHKGVLHDALEGRREVRPA